MAVEVFNLYAYVVEASSVDPDLAVFLGSNVAYVITGGFDPERIFVQSELMYSLEGKPANKVAVHGTSAVVVCGHTNAKVAVSQICMWAITE